MSLPLISLSDLPTDGRNFSGELRTDPFRLEGKFEPHFVPPLVYAVTVRTDDGDVIVEGSVSARFELLCARCGARTPWQVSLDPYLRCEAKEGDTLDLTAQLREDILLALPGYPRCEESNVDPRPCQAESRIAPESDFIPLSGEEASDQRGKDVWEALNRLSPGGPPSES